jgi:hypothetical protein
VPSRQKVETDLPALSYALVKLFQDVEADDEIE